MSIIKVKCTDQVLTFDNTPVIASGGLEENFLQVAFCSLWDGFTRTAVFWRTEREAYHVAMDEDNSCQVPPEVTGDEGVIYFGVFGVDATGRQRTSNVLTYRVEKGAITTGTKPSDPTPDIYTGLVAKYQHMIEVSEQTLAAEQAFEQALTAAQAAFEQTMTQRQAQHEQTVNNDQAAFERAMNADQAAFEQAMNADQAAFEQAMNAAQATFEQEIQAMIAAGLLPDHSVTAAKLVTSGTGAIVPSTIGAAPASHNHAAGDITSGILAAARGGTGVGSLAELAAALEPVMGGVKVAFGSYKGTNNNGYVYLNVDFVPKMVIITSNAGASAITAVGFIGGYLGYECGQGSLVLTMEYSNGKVAILDPNNNVNNNSRTYYYMIMG